MKKIILIVLSFAFTLSMSADDWKIQLVENDAGYMEIQMKCVNASLTPSSGDAISGMTFQIFWPTSLGANIDLICSNNSYNITDANATGTSGADTWKEYYMNPTPLNCPDTWTTDVWQSIATFKVDVGSGTGDFDVAPDNTFGAGLNWQFGTPSATTYHPDVLGSGIVGYGFPTIVYDRVWNGSGAFGGTTTDWAHWGNWDLTCGGIAGPPINTSNVYIPGTVSTFPSTNLSGTMVCNNLRIGTSASITVPATIGALAVNGKLFTSGTLIIVPNANATVSGDTYVEGAESIEIQSTSSGTGSFIDNGTITYGASGTAKVQTFLTNAASGTDFYIHQVGPTVNTTAGAGNGAVADDFTLASGDTYAYEWNEVTTEWVNISDTDPVTAGDGIILSSTDATNHTLELTGTLNTGTISPSITTGGSSLELLSNPYSSSVDFDALAVSNSAAINNKYWIWDPSAGSYVPRAGGTGGAQHIQVGQSFFVETIANGTFDFTNNERTHSNDPFRDVISDLLKITAHGGETSYLDRTYIRFDEDGTSGYDIDLEAIHWASMYEDATMLKSVAEDDTKLAINVLPLTDFQSETVSVPLMFSCGYTGEYILSVDNIESFDADVDIWLEDKLNNNIQIDFANNPDYYFSANTDDNENRFVVHFFGPTDINEKEIDNVTIYSAGKYAYIVNNSNEQINEIIIYDLSGRPVLDVLVSDQTSYRQFVSDNTGYYVVRVITNKKVYTEKVFIQNIR